MRSEQRGEAVRDILGKLDKHPVGPQAQPVPLEPNTLLLSDDASRYFRVVSLEHPRPGDDAPRVAWVYRAVDAAEDELAAVLAAGAMAQADLVSAVATAPEFVVATIDRLLRQGRLQRDADGRISRRPAAVQEFAIKIECVPLGDLGSALRRRRGGGLQAEAARQRDISNRVARGGETVAEVEASGMEDGAFWFAVRWFPITLDTWLATRPPLDQLLDMMARLAATTARLHAAGDDGAAVVHNDVKGANVALADEGRLLKFIDLGTTREHRAADGTLTFGGTPGYHPPGQLLPGPRYPYFDAFAVCATLFRAVVREPPRCTMLYARVGDSGTVAERFDLEPYRQGLVGDLRRLRDAMRASSVPNAESLATTLCELVERGLEPDPERREPETWLLDAALVLAALARLARGEEAPASPRTGSPPTPRPVPPGKRRRRWGRWAVGVWLGTVATWGLAANTVEGGSHREVPLQGPNEPLELDMLWEPGLPTRDWMRSTVPCNGTPPEDRRSELEVQWGFWPVASSGYPGKAIDYTAYYEKAPRCIDDAALQCFPLGSYWATKEPESPLFEPWRTLARWQREGEGVVLPSVWGRLTRREAAALYEPLFVTDDDGSVRRRESMLGKAGFAR